MSANMILFNQSSFRSSHVPPLSKLKITFNWAEKKEQIIRIKIFVSYLDNNCNSIGDEKISMMIS